MFCFGPDNEVTANVDQSMIGKDETSLKDADGKAIGTEMMKIRKSGEGTVEYRWKNPVSQKVVWPSSVCPCTCISHSLESRSVFSETATLERLRHLVQLFNRANLDLQEILARQSDTDPRRVFQNCLDRYDALVVAWRRELSAPATDAEPWGRLEALLRLSEATLENRVVWDWTCCSCRKCLGFWDYPDAEGYPVASSEAESAPVGDEFTKEAIRAWMRAAGARVMVCEWLGTMRPAPIPNDPHPDGRSLREAVRSIRDEDEEHCFVFGLPKVAVSTSTLIEALLPRMAFNYNEGVDHDVELGTRLNLRVDQIAGYVECSGLVMSEGIPAHFAKAVTILRECFVEGHFESSIAFCRSVIEAAEKEWLQKHGRHHVNLRDRAAFDKELREGDARERSKWLLELHSNYQRFGGSADEVRRFANKIIHAKGIRKPTEAEAGDAIRKTFSYVEYLFERPNLQLLPSPGRGR